MSKTETLYAAEMKITQGENWMVVLLKAEDPQNRAYFYLYINDGTKFNVKYQVSLNKKDVEFVDFSNDDCYLAYCYEGKPMIIVDISEIA
jgi:hypothetical protein